MIAALTLSIVKKFNFSTPLAQSEYNNPGKDVLSYKSEDTQRNHASGY